MESSVTEAPEPSGPRARRKRESLQRILAAASARLRREGLSGAAIAPVMQEAGLTHGAFYAHFRDKEDLAVAAFRKAFATERERWIGAARDRSWPERARRLAGRYLTRAHRDDPGAGCAFAALATDAARAPDAFREAYGEELRATLAAIRGAPDSDPMRPPPLDHAAAMLALCVGGLSLARAVNDPELSERLLAACREAAERLAQADDADRGEQTTRGPDPAKTPG
ncbi:TetR/AcrR family transcriptional regulator [uncultured Albimonas sp.]|uniref:TetR/AcrR family transcriptional regulator n=1 Tax=uncultured Albimonas sp. TaxID=1331701 RepID=UPI0030EBD444